MSHPFIDWLDSGGANKVLHPELPLWRYESDGDIGNRTYYAIRDNSDMPCGTERMDFPTKAKALAFVRNSNDLMVMLATREKR